MVDHFKWGLAQVGLVRTMSLGSMLVKLALLSPAVLVQGKKGFNIVRDEAGGGYR